MTIYIDSIKRKDVFYIEDKFSSYEIISMDKDVFVGVIKELAKTHGIIHTCYSAFINHCGRFHREYGPNWFGEELIIYAPEKAGVNGYYKRYDFNDKGQLKDWPYGIFG